MNRDEDRSKSVTDSNGSANGSRAQAHGDMDLQATQEALTHANERNVRILESITDAFAMLDFKWCFSYLNQRAEDIIQTTAEVPCRSAG